MVESQRRQRCQVKPVGFSRIVAPTGFYCPGVNKTHESHRDGASARVATFFGEDTHQMEFYT